MAKSTKKVSSTKTKKTTAKKTKVKKTQELKPAPPIDPGLVSVALSPEDLLTFANLMTVCAKTFEKLANEAATQNNDAAFTVLAARYKLSCAFAEKLAQFCDFPEPISREMH